MIWRRHAVAPLLVPPTRSCLHQAELGRLSWQLLDCSRHLFQSCCCLFIIFSGCNLGFLGCSLYEHGRCLFLLLWLTCNEPVKPCLLGTDCLAKYHQQLRCSNKEPFQGCCGFFTRVNNLHACTVHAQCTEAGRAYLGCFSRLLCSFLLGFWHAWHFASVLHCAGIRLGDSRRRCHDGFAFRPWLEGAHLRLMHHLGREAFVIGCCFCS